jgi:hypothetical protein
MRTTLKTFLIKYVWFDILAYKFLFIRTPLHTVIHLKEMTQEILITSSGMRLYDLSTCELLTLQNGKKDELDEMEEQVRKYETLTLIGSDAVGHYNRSEDNQSTFEKLVKEWKQKKDMVEGDLMFIDVELYNRGYKGN